MTVAELIAKLSELPQDEEIFVEEVDTGCGCCSTGEYTYGVPAAYRDSDTTRLIIG